MKIRMAALVIAALAALVARPVAARDMSCAEWLAYRMDDKSMQGLGLTLVTFVQGYVDGVNDFGDVFNGNLISEVSPGKFAPTPPSRPLSLENTVAVLDRQCTNDRTQSAHVVAVTELQSELARRVSPIYKSMTTILYELNEAKGYK